MGVDNFLESKRIHLKNGAEIIVNTMSEDGRVWKEVYYRKRGKTINIGSYSTYDYGMTRGWMECNRNAIALMSQHVNYVIDEPKVVALFDLHSKKLVRGSEEELTRCYKHSLGRVLRKTVKHY